MVYDAAMMTSVRWIVVLAVISAGGTARADFASMGKFMSTMSGYQQSFATASNAYEAQQARYRALAGNAGATTGATTDKPAVSDKPAAPVKHLPITATDFKPAAKGHPIIDQILAENVAPGERAQAKASIEQAFAQLEKSGVRPNNLANSVALAIEVSMLSTNGYQGSDAAEAELLASVNDAIAANPAFKKMSAKDLQTTNDVLWLSSALMVQFIQAGDAQSKKQGQQMAAMILGTLTGAK